MPIPIGVLAVAGAGAAGGGPAYELIQTQVLSSTATEVTFSSIPQTFRHLQIRYSYKSARNVNSEVLEMRVNGVTNSALYADHILRGNGSNVASGAGPDETQLQIGEGTGSASVAGSNNFGVGVIDLHDYSSSVKNKTFRSLSGFVISAGDGAIISLRSAGYFETTAVTSLTFINENASGSIAINSRFSIYGIRG